MGMDGSAVRLALEMEKGRNKVTEHILCVWPSAQPLRAPSHLSFPTRPEAGAGILSTLSDRAGFPKPCNKQGDGFEPRSM